MYNKTELRKAYFTLQAAWQTLKDELDFSIKEGKVEDKDLDKMHDILYKIAMAKLDLHTMLIEDN